MHDVLSGVLRYVLSQLKVTHVQMCRSQNAERKAGNEMRPSKETAVSSRTGPLIKRNQWEREAIREGARKHVSAEQQHLDQLGSLRSAPGSDRGQRERHEPASEFLETSGRWDGAGRAALGTGDTAAQQPPDRAAIYNLPFLGTQDDLLLIIKHTFKHSLIKMRNVK